MNWYQVIFYQPVLNLLIYVYDTIALHSLGFAIILVTILIRVVLFPFFHRGAKQQMLMQRIQPHVKKIQETHKDDIQKQSAALMALYKEHGINPFSSFLLLIIQIPIMIALYWAVRSGLGTGHITGLYSFVPVPSGINTVFLGIVNLANPSLILLLVAAAAQYAQARLAIYKPPQGHVLSPAERMARQMSFIGPLITLVIFYSLPAAVALYWITTSVFASIQQVFVNRTLREKYGS
ncbi:MAG TPA: YidC/Oxa1 family membrane protein insertase [Candidatus Paceibacterota bacterium]|nr:YidC/Oxa1 family membrane protein insertase [Candidatus Paceibacterota bacterium]